MNTRQDERDAGPEADKAEQTDKAEPTGKAEQTDKAEQTQPAEETEEAKPAEEEAKPADEDAKPVEKADKADEAEAAKPSDEADKVEDAKPSEEEVWSRFAPAAERPPGRAQRIAMRIGRVLSHEWTLACVGGLLLAVLLTWPTLRHPTTTIPQDLGDPTLVAWLISWSGHAILTDPTQLWHTNAFWPERYTLAFTDSLLGYAPLSLIGEGSVAAVARYNIVYVLIFALAFVGAYALIRQLGSGRTGATVAAIAIAYAPWRLAQAGHLHVLSSGGIMLALAMLARGHGWSLRHGYRPERRHAGWALAGWLVAAWQVTIGFGIGLPFVYVMALIVAVAVVGWVVRRGMLWRARRPFGARLFLADLAGGLIFANVAVLMALPYLTVIDQHPNAKRSAAEVELYSAPLRGFFTAPVESWLWGERHAATRAMLAPAEWEKALLPGFVLIGLAAAGLIFSIWSVRTRILLAAGVAVTAILCMGTEFAGDGRPGYMTLYDLLPGWDGMRTPGRLVLWTTLLLGILAAGAVSAFVERAGELTADRVPAEPGPLLRLATLIPIVLVLLEAVNLTPHPEVPRAPAALRGVEAPVLVLPTSQSIDQNIMLWSTDGFPRLVNGSSGFTPDRLQRTRETTATFPDAASIDYLRDLGVRTVVLLPDRTGGTPWERAAEAPTDGLGITREEVAGAIVFRLS